MPGAMNLRSFALPGCGASGLIRAPFLVLSLPSAADGGGSVFVAAAPGGDPGASGITETLGGSLSKSRSTLPGGQGLSW